MFKLVYRSLAVAAAMFLSLSTAHAGLLTGSGLILQSEIDNWFFTVTNTGQVTINVTETVVDDDDQFDSEINLYRWDGSLDLADFIENDDDGGNNWESLISRTLDAGTYLLRVGGYAFEPETLGDSNPTGFPGYTDYNIVIAGDFVAEEWNAVPEPATLGLLGMGLLGLGLARRRKTH